VLSTGVVTTLAGTAGMTGNADGIGAAARFNSPSGLAADGAGNLFIADNHNATIRKLELASAAVTTVVGVAAQRGIKLQSLPSRLNQPAGVAVSPGGQIFITDYTENAILTVQ
jgi:DNA-binding beta-propeller fold protein YncE